jgi:hypothetical protein
MLNRIHLLLLTGATVLTLNACASNPSPTAETTPASPVTPPDSAQVNTTPASSPTTASTPKEASAQHGGQVVEMGDYHLELVAAPEGENIHVDFWLLTGTDHASIGDAKVTANIQFPNGTQKTVDLTYDEAGKHYKALVPGFVAGEYRVVIQTEREGDKVNGRFNFSL